MAYEQRENSGSVFKNKKKEKDSHPHLQGDALIGGVSYWVSGWRKTQASGDEWISLSFKVKEAKPAEEPAPASPRTSEGKKGAAAFDDMPDSIPF